MFPSDDSAWNVKIEYPADGSPVVTFKDATITCDVVPQFSAGRNDNEFDGDIKFVIEGENYFSRNSAYNTTFWSIFTGTTTFTGGGKLKIAQSVAAGSGALMRIYGDLLLQDVDLELEIPAAESRDTNGIMTVGDMVIDGGSLKITSVNPYETGEDGWANYRAMNAALNLGGDLTIKNEADVQIIGSSNNRSVNSLVKVDGGDITIDNSNIEFAQVRGTYLKVFDGNNLPNVTATYTDSYTVTTSETKGTYDLTEGTFTAPTGDTVNTFADISEATLSGLNYFKIAAVTCVHIPEADDGDCTTAINCSLCGTELTPAAAAHTPAADDNDCSTDTVCTACGTVTTPAPGHTAPADRTSCDQPADCTVCSKQIPAGQHTGGTATCKDKAVCSVCSQPYGELSTTHVPEADDGDCTTAVKCSVCSGEAVAAKTHTFANGADTTCDNAGCNHTRVVEPKPDFNLSFATDGTKTDNGDGTFKINTSNMTSASGKATLTMKAGDPAKYYTTGKYSAIPELAENTYMKETNDTTNWNVKVEYPADGIPTVTLKGAVINNAGGLKFGGMAAAFKGDAKLVIETDSVINGGYSYDDALLFNHVGNATITGPGKLIVQGNAHENDIGAIGAKKANLIFDNANVTVLLSEDWGTSHGVSVRDANMTVKGGNLKIVGFDDSETLHKGPEGTVNYQLNANAVMAGIFVQKVDANAAAGDLTIEDGANVSVAVSVTAPYDNYKKHKLQAIYTDGKFTVKDATFEVGLVGKVMDDATLFGVLPTLEFTNNSYTVTATKTKYPAFTKIAYQYDPYTYDGTMTYAEGKEVDAYDSSTKLASLTYFKVAPGGAGSGTTGGSTGGGTTGGSSNPNTGDINVLLTVAVSLASAVSFGGVTVLRKKNS